VALFSEGITDSYISPSELQSHRAIAPGQWNPKIADIFEADVRGRLANPLVPAPGETTQIFGVGEVDGKIITVFLVTFSRDAQTPYAILEDVVVSPDARGHGIGGRFMDWLAQECRDRKIYRQFLESGGDNSNAHHFFEAHGFHQISIVMMNELS
jgi:GNAT superfamily N-acetyltransferase